MKKGKYLCQSGHCPQINDDDSCSFLSLSRDQEVSICNERLNYKINLKNKNSHIAVGSKPINGRSMMDHDGVYDETNADFRDQKRETAFNDDFILT